jgi:hypothetical protein
MDERARPSYASEEDRLRAHLVNRVPHDRVETAWNAAAPVFADTWSMQKALDAGVAAAGEGE